MAGVDNLRDGEQPTPEQPTSHPAPEQPTSPEKPPAGALGTYETYIAKSRYAKFVDAKKRRESWDETVDRYVNFVFDSTPGIRDDPTLKADVRSSILNLEVMPSMRAMMTAGKAAEQDNTSMYNCSYIPVDDPKAFDEAMYILMSGTGVGFTVEAKYVNRLPDVPDQLFPSDHVVVVHDSRAGWAKALRMLIAVLYAGEIPKWDVSKLRPAGARLKTFGGRASGPLPLVELFAFVVKTFKAAVGRKLSSIECHDIMTKVGEVVVSGGVRRSAMISLSDLDDERMRAAKSGPWWETAPNRALANNSAVYTETPTVGKFMKEWLSLYESHSGERGIFNRDAVKKICKRVGRDPAHEWGTNPCLPGDAMVHTRGGLVPIVDVAVGTEVLTFDGYRRVTEWYDQGEQALVRIVTQDGEFKCTPNHRMAVLTAVDQYEWKRADELSPGDRLLTTRQALEGSPTELPGFGQPSINKNAVDIVIPELDADMAWFIGLFHADGNVTTRGAISLAFGIDEFDIADKARVQLERFGVGVKVKRIPDKNAYGVYAKSVNLGAYMESHIKRAWTEIRVPDFITRARHDVKMAYLAGVLDGDGCAKRRVWIVSTVYPSFAKDIQNLAYSCGLETRLGVQQSGEWKPCHNVMVITLRSIEALASVPQLHKELPLTKSRESHTNGFPTTWIATDDTIPYVAKQRMGPSNVQIPAATYERHTDRAVRGCPVRVERVEPVTGMHKTYDIGVEDRHEFFANGYLTHNCAEIILRPYQFCNLTEVIVRSTDTVDDLKRKVRIATILGTVQSTFTKFPYLRKIWKKNTEEERLLGVSLTGIFDNTFMCTPSPELDAALRELRTHARAVNADFADRLGIPHSAAITCVKPSGTVSQLVNSASGIHPRHSKYYIRRVRGDKKDPCTRFLVDSGVRAEDDLFNKNAVVFSFAMKAPDGLVREDITPLDHLKLWLLYQRAYCCHKPSVTISVAEDEWPRVGAWVWDHFSEMTGVSFLPYDGGSYKQAPYEECTEAEYLALAAATPIVDWSKFVEHDDYTESAKTLACTAGGCEL